MPENLLPPLALPSQQGRTAIVTGANAGIGFATASALAEAGARVVLAVRDQGRGDAAAAEMRNRGLPGPVEVRRLDVSDLDDVARFAAAWGDQPVDLLINNAGVSGTKRRGLSAQGFDTIMATNLIGHAALTGRLLPVLQRGTAPRVVSLGSLVVRQAKLDPSAIGHTDPEHPGRAYADSKLGCLVFACELQRRSDTHGWGVTSVGAHPGWSRTRIFGTGPLWQGSLVLGRLTRLAQSPADGAQPILLAATATKTVGGSYFGPSRLQQVHGRPVQVPMPATASDAATGHSLWRTLRELTDGALPD